MSSQQLSVLSTISHSRATYGAQNADYVKYVHHCTAKVAKLRKTTGLQQRAKKSKSFNKQPVSQVKDVDSRHLLIALYDAERAWAASQAGKAEMNKQAAHKSAIRHRVVQKLARAKSHAATLSQLIQGYNALSRAEAIAYQHVLQATYAFEKMDDASVLTNSKIAAKLLDILAEKSTLSATQGYAFELLEDVGQMERISRNRLSGSSPMDMDTPYSPEIQSLIDQLDAIASNVSQIQTDHVWKDQTIHVKNPTLAKALSEATTSLNAFHALQTNQKKSRPSLAGYEKVLTKLGQAEDVALRLVSDNQVALDRSHSEKFEQASAPLKQALDYTSFLLLSLRIERDHELISRNLKKITSPGNPQPRHGPHSNAGARAKPHVKKSAKGYAGIIKLYDGLLASFERLRELSIVENDMEIASRIETRIEQAKTQRCFYLSAVYALLKQFEKAVLINDHASLYLRQCRTALSLELPTDYPDHLPPVDAQDLDSLDQHITAQRDRIVKDWYNARLSDSEKALGVDTLTLSESKEGLATKRPKVFDITFNYVTEIDMDAIAAHANGGPPASAQQQQPQSETNNVNMSDAVTDSSEKQDAGSARKKGLWSFFSR